MGVDFSLLFRPPLRAAAPKLIATGLGDLGSGHAVSATHPRCWSSISNTKPGDLPIERPRDQSQDSKQIGLTVPPNVLARAKGDQVIEENEAAMLGLN